MKRKLFLLLCTLLTSVGMWAGILDGWTKMETTVVANPQNYYFIILHTDNTLMLGVSKHCSARKDGVLDTPASASSTYDFISYQTASEPCQDLAKVWTIESCTADGYTSAYILRGLANVDCPANIGLYQWELMTDGAVHENIATDAAFNLDATGTMWKIQDATATTYYWGAWEDAVYINNERVAGNAGGNGHEVGNYNIYYMDRVTFNKKYQFLGGTNMNHVIVNRDFEYGTLTGWTNTRNTTYVCKSNDDSKETNVNVNAKSGTHYAYLFYAWAGVGDGQLDQTVSFLPNGTYSSTIYLCHDMNYVFNGTSAEVWGAKTPANTWTEVNVENQEVTNGSTTLSIRNYWQGGADNASLTFIPSAVGDIATAYTAETATEVYKWYRITIPSEGSCYWIKTSNAATLRYTTSASTLQTAGTENVCSAGAVTQTSFAPSSTVYIATTESTILSLEDPYAALNDAISTAEVHTLGFDADEYAPYTNVEALTRLASAKSIYDAKTATYAEVVAAKEALENATWTANDVEKDAVYNGNMAVADGTNPKGWARQNDGWGKQVDSSGETAHDFSKTTNNTAWYYNNNNSSYYGGVGHYTMPLKGSTTYLLRVKYCSQGTDGGGLVTSLRATVKKDETTVLNAHELGGNSTRTFEERSVTFTTTDAGNYVLELTNTGNFYFTDVSILKTATAADYAALNAEIAAHTPGFEVGEYAPYNNVDAMVALAAAKAIDQEAANLKSDVQDATDALTGATWTVNTELMDAIYDGQFASYTEDELNKSFKENGIKFPGGWLHDNSAVSTTDHIRQIATFSSFEGGRAMFFHTGTVSYGQTTGYTMPLRANAVYKFSFQYAGWSGYGTNPPSISILNENNEGMALTALPEGASAPGSGSTRYTVYFATDATPGNYIFKYQSPDNTNSTIGGLSLIRVDALPFSASGSTNYLPGTYSKVSVDRPMSSGTWNTLVIPVDMAIPGEWTVKEMDNFSESTLTFKKASSIVAGTPYLVKTTETIDNIIASDVEVKALSVVNNITKNGLTMKGVYANGYVPVSDGSATRYVVSGDYMYRVNSTVSIKPFRAYFELEGGNNAREIILNFNDDFTAINAIDVAENEFGAQKDGKYLIDGKIVIVKNGVKYGTNGQKLN